MDCCFRCGTNCIGPLVALFLSLPSLSTRLLILYCNSIPSSVRNSPSTVFQSLRLLQPHHIATSKLCSFHSSGLSHPSDDPDFLVVHATGRLPHSVPIKTVPLHEEAETPCDYLRHIYSGGFGPCHQFGPGQMLYTGCTSVGILFSWSQRDLRKLTQFTTEIRSSSYT